MSNRLLVPKHHRKLILPERARFAAPALIIPGIMPIPFFKAAVVVPGVTQYDSGSGNFVVPLFNTLTIEAWGGGAATSGINGSSAGQAPTSSPTASTVTGTGVSISAGAGVAGNNFLSGSAAGGVGGTATGGNTTNTSGGNGDARTPLTFQGKKGGDSPNGGVGGAGTAVYPTNAVATVAGNPGAVPGGGGASALQVWSTGPGAYANGVSTASGAGAYSKSVYSSGGLAVGLILAYAVGVGGVSLKGVAAPGGDGGHGRVKFTVA